MRQKDKWLNRELIRAALLLPKYLDSTEQPPVGLFTLLLEVADIAPRLDALAEVECHHGLTDYQKTRQANLRKKLKNAFQLLNAKPEFFIELGLHGDPRGAVVTITVSSTNNKSTQFERFGF